MPSPSSPPLVAVNELSQGALAGLRVLVVEDDPAQRAMLCHILDPYVQSTMEGSDSHHAWDLFLSSAPDLVIADLKGPMIGGMSFCERVKSVRPMVPVVLTTSGHDPSLLLRAIEIGADGFVTKPVTPYSLHTALNRVARLALADQQHRLLSAVYNTLSEAIMITDHEENILEVNPAFTRITGYSREEVVGHSPDMFRSGRHDQSFYEAMWFALGATGHWAGEIQDRRKDGEIYAAWMCIDRVTDAEGRTSHYVAAWSDISERKEAEDRIYHLAHYDVLTGLPNRSLFDDRLKQALEAARRHSNCLALMFLDVDRFKLINDTLGHQVGDELLVNIADRLKTAIRAEDTVSRHGGDEFLVLLPNLKDEQDATAVARKILTQLAEPCTLGKHALQVTASLGIALFPQHGQHASELVGNADMAMYRAKQLGRNNFQLYQAEISSDALERMRLENELRIALAQHQFLLHYLPRRKNGSNRIIGVSALLRWQHPDKGLLMPSAFLGVAEEAGLLLNINDWVLNEVIRQGALWRDQGYSNLRVSINLPEIQFRQPDFVTHLERELATAKLPGYWLEFEFSELFLMKENAHTLERLSALKSLGVGITIDDFGVGYSNLNVLRRLPVDTIKIDRSLVFKAPESRDDAAVVDAILSMARSMGLIVVAEGVENEEHAGFFSQRTCDQVQGYHYGVPMPAAQLRLSR